MLAKSLFAAALLVGVSSVAMAQSSTTTTNGSPMTEQQIQQKLEQQGYSDIQLKPAATRSLSGTSSSTTASGSSSQPELFTGTAMKNGKTVNIEVNGSGEVTEK